MSFEKSDALSQERKGLRKAIKSQVSELEALQTKIKQHTRASGSVEVIDIGTNDDVIETEIASARKALGAVEHANEEFERAKADLKKAREDEAARIKTRNIAIGIGAAVVLIVIFSVAGG